uniref:Glycosyltransferase 2-like domain-containing protein n=1 Tax=Salix viminalis TaxID=40686 RepID=A0A6N2MZF4_SALVM
MMRARFLISSRTVKQSTADRESEIKQFLKSWQTIRPSDRSDFSRILYRQVSFMGFLRQGTIVDRIDCIIQNVVASTMEERVRRSWHDCWAEPVVFDEKQAKTLKMASADRLLIAIRVVPLGLFLAWRIRHPNREALWLWGMSITCEIWFAQSWILDQLPKLCPVHRVTDLSVLKQRFESPNLRNPKGRSHLKRRPCWNNPKNEMLNKVSFYIFAMLAPPDAEPVFGVEANGESLLDTTEIDIRLPMLVSVSREKRPGFDHNKKAGAMNALVRTSAIMSNGPSILNLDCDHYISNSLALREGMCFMLDRGGDRICHVQFPQQRMEMHFEEQRRVIYQTGSTESFDGQQAQWKSSFHGAMHYICFSPDEILTKVYCVLPAISLFWPVHSPITQCDLSSPLVGDYHHHLMLAILEESHLMTGGEMSRITEGNWGNKCPSCGVGFARAMYSPFPQWSRLLGGVFFSFWVLSHLYPFAKGSMGRRGRVPTMFTFLGEHEVSVPLMKFSTSSVFSF